MLWQLKTFGQLSAAELFAIYRARVAVFVVEQRCAYQEVDEHDLAALHLSAVADGALAAYCRMVCRDDGIHIGRVLVVETMRGSGLAKELMRRALAVCAERWPERDVLVQAQAYLQPFYQVLGFRPLSAVYLEDGIAHLDMGLGARR